MLALNSLINNFMQRQGFEFWISITALKRDRSSYFRSRRPVLADSNEDDQPGCSRLSCTTWQKSPLERHRWCCLVLTLNILFSVKALDKNKVDVYSQVGLGRRVVTVALGCCPATSWTKALKTTQAMTKDFMIRRLPGRKWWRKSCRVVNSAAKSPGACFVCNKFTQPCAQTIMGRKKILSKWRRETARPHRCAALRWKETAHQFKK